MSIEELEKKRKKTLLIIEITIVICIATVFFYFILENPFNSTHESLFDIIQPTILFLFVIVVLIVATKVVYDSFVSVVKKYLFKDVLDDLLGNNYYYGKNEGISKNDIVETNSLYVHIIEGSDYIESSYKNIKFKMSDIKIIEIDRDSDGSESERTVFSGQWMIFDFNKYFKSNIQIWEKVLIGNIEKTKDFNLNKIEVEDIEFGKKFDVFAQNDLEAYYVLTPSMIEKIMEVEKELNGVLLFVFLNNRLHVGIKRNKDLFKVSILNKIDLESYKELFYGDLSIIFKLIDLLNLDNSLFKLNTGLINTQ